MLIGARCFSGPRICMSLTKFRASVLHQPPVSSGSTRRRHLSAATSSELLDFLFTLSLGQDGSVDNGSISATSLSSVAATCTFISRNLTFRLTVAPASRQIRAIVLQPARLWTCCTMSSQQVVLSHSHIASVRRSRRRSRSKINVWNRIGCT